MAYVITAWVGCAWYVFDQAIGILAIGVFVGITIPEYFRVTRRDNPAVLRRNDDLDIIAKAALIVVSLCVCAILIYQIDKEFHVYKSYAGSPIFAIAMIYFPALILGIASTAYGKLIAILLAKLARGARARFE